jgi:hypothetical protein
MYTHNNFFRQIIIFTAFYLLLIEGGPGGRKVSIVHTVHALFSISTQYT